MKPGFFALVLLLPALLACSYAQTAHKRPAAPAGSSPQEIAEAIQHLEGDLRMAIMKGDPTWFEEHLAESYAETDSDGKIMSRAEVIQFFRTTAPEYDSWNLSEGTARTYNGNTVILTARLELEGTLRGQKISGAFRVTRVWIKQGSDWQLAASQYTRIAA